MGKRWSVRRVPWFRYKDGSPTCKGRSGTRAWVLRSQGITWYVETKISSPAGDELVWESRSVPVRLVRPVLVRISTPTGGSETNGVPTPLRVHRILRETLCPISTPVFFFLSTKVPPRGPLSLAELDMVM